MPNKYHRGADVVQERGTGIADSGLLRDVGDEGGDSGGEVGVECGVALHTRPRTPWPLRVQLGPGVG